MNIRTIITTLDKIREDHYLPAIAEDGSVDTKTEDYETDEEGNFIITYEMMTPAQRAIVDASLGPTIEIPNEIETIEDFIAFMDQHR